MAVSTVRKIHKDVREIEQELTRLIYGEVRFDDFSRTLYSTDASIYEMKPMGVVLPRNKDDVLAAVDVAHRSNVPIVPRGGGTSLAGQTVNHGIVIDFSKYMDQVVEINSEEGWASVQPGIVLDHLNNYLSKHSLHYAPDPSTSNRACVGGTIGNNSCGSHSISYGKTIDHIKELSVILSDATEAKFSDMTMGEVQAKLSKGGLESSIYGDGLSVIDKNIGEVNSRYPKIMRRVGGYNLNDVTANGLTNLSRLIVGSEGTLCIVTEAKINLEKLPKLTGLAVVHFEDIVQASEATNPILSHNPSAVELIGEMILNQCRESVGFSRRMSFVDGHPGALLLVEFFSENQNDLTNKMTDFKRDMEKKKLGYSCVNIVDKDEQNNVWAVRKAGLGLLMSVTGNSKPIPFVEDTAVDPEKLGSFVSRFEDVVERHGTKAGYYGHASVGCLHIRPLIDLKIDADIKKMVAISSEISDLVLEFGGAFSGEHGDGIVRGAWSEKIFGPKLVGVFREIKNIFDPRNIMNPGKIIDTPSMTSYLRYGPGYSTNTLNTSLSFSEQGDYAGAVEMCNGMGACRKSDGVMCPSYQVTKEEEHSTRGRANLLRAVLSGALPYDTLTSKRLYDALDLCLECKGCKAECPSSVDMAKLKYEFLERYNAANGIPLRSKIFASINNINRLGSFFSPVSNWISERSIVRYLLDRFIGIHRKRSLPKFTGQTFTKWFEGHTKVANTSENKVVIFNDTFMNYNYPEVGRATVELLEMAGFEVMLADVQCCGRPMVSKGMLSRAKRNARANVDMLYGYIQEGAQIIGCEPSCLLTLTDEYPDLLNDDKSKVVARNSFLIDEFLVRIKEAGDLSIKFSDLQKNVLFHGHCHQKALRGSDFSLKALSLPPNYQVEMIDAGCCGMAGAFGYEKEHYELSMEIGKQRLFPAILSKGVDWDVAVMGVSCRQQIEHGIGKKARHLVEILREAAR